MILVVGSANADIVLKVDHFTEVGETQVVQSLEVHGGGKGANQALTAAKLGGRCAFISCVGRDEYGKMLKASLEGHGITGVGAVQNAPTGRAYIEVDKTGRNRILVVPGANHSLTVEVFEKGDLVNVTGISKGKGFAGVMKRYGFSLSLIHI